jgi:hypothetical protein
LWIGGSSLILHYMKNTNTIYDSENGTHYIIDTPQGRIRPHYSWVISEMDLEYHTPWVRKDLETLTDEQMESHPFPKGVKGFFIR